MIIGYHGNWHICVIPLMKGQLCLPSFVYMTTTCEYGCNVHVANKDRLDGTIALLQPSLPLGLVCFQYECNI